MAQTYITSYSADLPLKDSFVLEQINIEKSNFPFYYRIYLNGQIINVYKDSTNNFKAEVVNFIKSYYYQKVNGEYSLKANKLHTERITIDNILADSIGNLLVKSNQIYIPHSDTLIKHWDRWYLHCGNLDFEIKSDQLFKKQSFHCPWNQPDSVAFKDIILFNYMLLKKEFRLDSVYNSFWLSLPKGAYYSNSGYGMTYKMTDKQEEQWKNDKPRRDYLKSIKDTIDIYINSELARIKPTYKNYPDNCYETFYLTFSKKGRLRKIKTHSMNRATFALGMMFYLEDVYEMYKCKSQIRKVFRKMKLKSFDLRYEFRRSFNFNSGDEWTLTDDTIY